MKKRGITNHLCACHNAFGYTWYVGADGKPGYLEDDSIKEEELADRATPLHSTEENARRTEYKRAKRPAA